MRYFFHILNEHERVRDHDGEEFANLASAREEAIQSARDLIAEELLCGRPAPSQWRIQIALEDDTILETVALASLLMGEGRYASGPRVKRKVEPELIAHAKATFTYARTTNAEIRHHLSELRDNLQALAQLNRAFTKLQR
jgi:hypothetical protein